jgi:hypothetical protein
MISNEQPYGSAIGQEIASGHSARLARQREALREELSQISDRAGKGARTCRSKARFWSRVYFMVGLPAAILAAGAGATALASASLALIAGSIALVSAGLTAAATFLDSATRQTSYNNLAAGWQVLANDARMRLVVDVDSDDWLLHEARGCLENLANRERKLLEGKAPDAEAEAEARAEIEKIRAQAVAARAEAMADQIRAAQMFAAEQGAKLGAETVKGRTLATVMKAQADVPIQSAEETAAPSVLGSDLLLCRREVRSLAQVRSGSPASMLVPNAHAVSAVMDRIDLT